MKTGVRLLCLVLLPLFAAGLTWSGRHFWHRWTAVPAIPILDCPPTVDLGEREFNEVAVGHFIILNRGHAALQLEQFFTSCSCAGVEQDVDGRYKRVGSVVIPPQDQAELIVRVNVGVPAGERQVVQVVFSSNDPLQPKGRIEVVVPRVKGGVYATPKAVIFGQIRVGTVGRQLIELYDNGRLGRRIDSVRSLAPDRFDARLLPINDLEPPTLHERGGRLIARLEVTAQTPKPGPLNGFIEVSLVDKERKPDRIPVYGEVVQDIECRTSTLILPRKVDGRFVYAGQVLLRHRDGQRFELETENAPPGIAANVRHVPDGDFPWLLEVECARPLPVPLGEKTIRLRVRSGKEERIVTVPILLTVEPPPEDQVAK